MPAHGSWRTLVAGSSLLLVVACEPSVSARAVWIDVAGHEGSQTIHVYDQGELRELELNSASTAGSIASLRLDPHGHGLLVRSDEQRAAWIDLADGRRLPVLLPQINLVGDDDVEFAADGSALLWAAFDPKTSTGSLELLPLAPGLPLERTDAGGMQVLVRPGKPSWLVSASDAPVVLVAEADGTTLGLWRWPSDPDDAMVVRELASATRMGIPDLPVRSSKCEFPAGCVSTVAIDPAGEVALFLDVSTDGWQRFDVRAPAEDAPLSFPTGLDELIDSAGIGLIHVIDRDRSLWLSSGLLHWWNQRSGELRSLPVLGQGPFQVFAIDRGRGVLFMSITGPILRADRDGLRWVSLVTTPCLPASDPVASPEGRWIAWTCVDDVISELPPTQETIVRVSALGLDRFTGVPMTPLAIDDEGHLLLTSDDAVVGDLLDGVDARAVPRNLYVLSREDVLTRIDELEPSPAAVSVGGQLAAYIQAASL
jgi:hypothetical protein